MDILVLLLIIILLFSGVPAWRPATWGYGPMGIVGFVLLVVLLIWLVGGVGHPVIIHDWRSY